MRWKPFTISKHTIYNISEMGDGDAAPWGSGKVVRRITFDPPLPMTHGQYIAEDDEDRFWRVNEDGTREEIFPKVETFE